MSLVKTAVERPVGTIMLSLGLLVVGLTASRELVVDLLPSVDFPRISIVTLYEGVGPEEIETLVTRPIEQQVSTIEGIETIESQSAEGISRVQLQFTWGTDLDVAVADVRAYLDRLGSRLPDEAERPVVYKFDLSSVPVGLVGVSGGGDPRRLRHLAEEALSRRLERLVGVANVDVRGGRVREIQVNLDAAQLAAQGVSAAEVKAALASENRNVSSGDVRAAGRELLVRSLGEWERPQDIAEVVVAIRDGHAVRVRDLGVVDDTFTELKAEQWVNLDTGITMSISKQSGANTVEVVKRVRAEVDRINAEYGGRIQLQVLEDASDFIRRSVSNVQQSALVGSLLAVLILLLFLRNLRATTVIAVAIPLSVLAALALMFFSGFTLNVISFGGLALGIGMLVDNGIVILENIYRKREDGLPPGRAAIEGAREVVPAVVAGTLTTVVVFAPVVFLGGFAAVFFGEMAAVVVFALLCSLLVAVTLVPSISARILGGSVRGGRAGPLRAVSRGIERGLAAVERGYLRVVRAALAGPWTVVILSLALLAASFQLVPAIGFELMPETDEGQIEVDVELPGGTPLSTTSPLMIDLQKKTRQVLRPEEIDNILMTAGPENWWRPDGSNVGEMEINLVQASERERPISELIDLVRQRLIPETPDASFRIRAGNANFLMRVMRGGRDERLVVEIRGHERETADALAREVLAAMRATEGVANPYVDEEERVEERAVRIRGEAVADLGLTRAAVADALETYVLGNVVTRYRERGDEYDVRVQLREADRRDVAQLERLPVLLPSGGVIPLSAVADFEPHDAPTAIEREDQERIVRVQGATTGRSLGDVVGDLRARLNEIVVPEGFTLAIGGEHQEQEETFGGLQIGIILALFLVYMVMAVQFESVLHPLVIMASIPFAFIGVVISLVLTGTTFNMNSFLGAIVLVGIVVNNAIVLVDTINLLRRKEQLPLTAAVLKACGRRLRPILMTTLTTMLAMVPLAIGVGEGSEVQAPLARVIVGGLASSTLVTLVLVPSLYLLVERRRATAAVTEPEALASA